MAVEKMVMVGVLPEAVVVDPGDQVVWFSNAGNLKIEFDSQRSPVRLEHFSSAPGRPPIQRSHAPRPEPRLVSVPPLPQ